MFHLIAAGIGAYIFIALVMALFAAGGRYTLFGLFLVGGLLLVIIRAFLKKG